MNLLTLVPDILKSTFGIIDKMVPDKDLARKLKAEMQARGDDFNKQVLDAQTQIIVAEAQGGSWLKQSWRPITMLVFVSLVAAHWLGLTSPNITEAVVIELLGIVKVGLGGYVVGRSVEQSVKAWKK